MPTTRSRREASAEEPAAPVEESPPAALEAHATAAEGADSCAVCLEPITDDGTGDSAVVAWACGHKYHAGCAVRWLQVGQGRCPCCRHQPAGEAGDDANSDSYSDDYYDDEDDFYDEDEVAHQAWHAAVRATAIANEEAMRKAVSGALAKSRSKHAPRELARSAKRYRTSSAKHADVKRTATQRRTDAIAAERDKRRKDDKEYAAFFKRIQKYKDKERKELNRRLKVTAEKLAPVRAAEKRAERALMNATIAKGSASESLAVHMGWEKYVSPPCPWS
jgi:hypothetical protein